jgi:hypothetical protein
VHLDRQAAHIGLQLAVLTETALYVPDAGKAALDERAGDNHAEEWDKNSRVESVQILRE